MTTTFKVFHAKPKTDAQGRVTGIKGGFGFEPTTFPDDFTCVATVQAQAIGQVFELTNHIDHAWPENPGIVIAQGLDPARLRSTSVGDIVSDESGFYAVAPSGFLKLDALDENFQSQVPSLYKVYGGIQ